MSPAPVTVGIPTFARGLRLFETLDHVFACDPPPAEIIVHVDQSDGQIERELAARFPAIRILSSLRRVGPGGGRHRCIQSATQPFFASFDDDSWPVDRDIFGAMTALFEEHPRAAILVASIYHPHQVQPERRSEVHTVTDYTGCGYGIRCAAYRETTGHVDRYCPYGLEETDVALQLHALGWTVLHSRSLRVFHNTELSHHGGADIVAGTVQNVALRAFLRYPVGLWPRAVLQLGNVVFYMIRMRRFAGLAKGLWGIPATLLQYSSQRRQLPADRVLAYLKARPRLTS